mmetsp:Transcript_15284/g.30822  ORF Transcript_15284/g.30822 Transcript_15284/m.30822 type:complete len:246 (+) Transcript_15284:729-1466(+)
MRRVMVRIVLVTVGHVHQPLAEYPRVDAELFHKPPLMQHKPRHDRERVPPGDLLELKHVKRPRVHSLESLPDFAPALHRNQRRLPCLCLHFVEVEFRVLEGAAFAFALDRDGPEHRHPDRPEGRHFALGLQVSEVSSQPFPHSHLSPLSRALPPVLCPFFVLFGVQQLLRHNIGIVVRLQHFESILNNFLLLRTDVASICHLLKQIDCVVGCRELAVNLWKCILFVDLCFVGSVLVLVCTWRFLS